MNNLFDYKVINNKKVKVYGLNDNAIQIYITELFEKTNQNIILVANSLYEATKIYNSMGGKTNVLLFPVDEKICDLELVQSPELAINRIETLNKITDNKKYILITNIEGYLKKVPSEKEIKENNICFKLGEEISREELIIKLNKLGYAKETLVTKTGEYAVRGYIIDIFPTREEQPIRIEFFGNTIETIKYFNTDSQISSTNKNDIEILPLFDFHTNGEKLYKSFKPYITIFNKTDEKDLPVYNRQITISEIFNKESKNSIDEIYSISEINRFNGNTNTLEEYISKSINGGKTVIINFDTKEKIYEFIKTININYTITTKTDIKKQHLNIIKDNYESGFEINNYIYISESTIFNLPSTTYRNTYRFGKRKIDNNIEMGDYVVHVGHGIGKYLGIFTITKDKIKKDYIKILYKDNDILYIPVDKINLISRYSSVEGARPPLSKLGTNQWKNQKNYVREKVREIAKELIELSAIRLKSKGFTYLEDDSDQKRFEDDFEYIETEDQLKAISEIKEDMYKQIPMDRLICGDVGYGKTEVAFRAIFKAIKSGKQVIFLCPTTILSSQHYKNAITRFSNYGINIELLNRFTSTKTKKEIMQKVESGETDLLIGTHSVLNEKIKYKDLGLLIIDEEQRFGVLQKEKIKKYKNEIDVLALSATPIPRTLQMSLAGIRNLSTIETPPINRYPIQTYVLPENIDVIRDSIYKELARNGQIFVLFNNVEKINDVVLKIKQIAPNSHVGCIHGKMTKQDIEVTMKEFVENNYNILVCTTIIETGIDIKNVNTLIVLNADYFGLSQLYQIRGRIGRSDRIAYAYFMYDTKKVLSEVARKRLDAIKEFTELGSGYLVAERDLAIRGAGDILGSEQSGFINTIGYELYLKILNEEIEKAKGKNIELELEDTAEPQINIETHISNDYVSEEELKIEIHKKIGEIETKEDIRSLKYEFENRFGKISESINIYMHEKLLEKLSKEIMVFEILIDRDQICVTISKKIEYININELIFKILKTGDFIDIKFKNNMLKIYLQSNKIEKHYVFYLIEIFELIKEGICS